jgi:hypothetical protein
MAMFQRQKDAGRFVPFVDATTLRCKAKLPWWSGHMQQQGEAFYPLAGEIQAAQAAGGRGRRLAVAVHAHRPPTLSGSVDDDDDDADLTNDWSSSAAVLASM